MYGKHQSLINFNEEKLGIQIWSPEGVLGFSAPPQSVLLITVAV